MSPKTEFRPILRPLALAAAALVLAACGGGGGGGDPATPGPGGPGGPATPMSISGVVVDGYIRGAVVDCLNGGSRLASAISNAEGRFAFELPAGQSCDTVESHGGVDVGLTPNDPSDDVLRPAGIMRSPVPSGTSEIANLIVSPLSTLVQALVANGSTRDDAAAQVAASLGLPSGAALLDTDPATDLTLFRATNAVAQLVSQTTAALAAAGGIESADGIKALASHAIAALADRLSDIGPLDQIEPTGLTPDSPLLAVIAQAARAAKADTHAELAGKLDGVEPDTLALIAAPLVAGAANAVWQAGSLGEVVARSGTIVEQDRTTSIVSDLSSLLGRIALADEREAVLAMLAGAAAFPDPGSGIVVVTIDGQTAKAPVPVGPNNFVRLAGDQLVLENSDSTQATATLEQFESSAGVALSRNLARVSFKLEQAGDAVSQAREVPMAIEVSDATRVLQAIVDTVEIAPVAGGGYTASVPPGTKLFVYARSASKQTESPIEIALDGAGLDVVSTDDEGRVSLNVERILSIDPGSIVPGSALADLSLSGLSGGSFSVTAVIGELRVARSVPGSGSGVTLATPYTVTLGAGDQSISGHGVKGTVVVGN